MAKQVSEILIKLGLQGVEGLDKLKGAFRELEKSIGPNNAAIERARQSIIDYGRDSRNTEQVIKGQIDALRGLQSQVERGSSTWAQLATDIEQFRQASRRTDSEIEVLRQSILNSASTHNQSRDSVQGHIRSLKALSNQASLTGTTLSNLRRDIANLEQQIEVAEQGSRRFRSALGQALAVNPQSILNQWRAYRQVLQDSASSADDLATAEQRLRSLSGAPRIEQRRAISAQAEIVGSAEYQRRFGVGGTALTEQLPDVSAALSQQLRELSEDLQYTARSTETYLQVAVRMAELQRELTATTQGLGAAITAQLRNGELAPTARNLQEAVSQLRREMAELDTTTTAGAQTYANNANAARNLERQLNDLAQSYRHVEDAARSASTQTGGINPILPSGARNPAYRAPLSPAQENAYPEPIGPLPFPEAGRRAQRDIESALDEVNRIYENSKVQRAEIQAKYDNLYAEKLLQGLDLEGQIRDKAFRDELAAFDRQGEARDRKRRGRLTAGQAVQAAGAAISGGIFGGPEGFLGGVGGAAIGSAIPGLGVVGGSFAGAAIGAQVGIFRQQLGQFTEQAAQISKLRLGLAGVSKDLKEFETSTRAVEAASQSLLLPLADTYRYYTQLRASTVELNYSADETRKILEGTASAVLKTGGSLADVDGAMRAVVQILSKGKAAAEEVRGQLGERFPGAVIKFAQANKMSVQELDQAFQAGTVTIDKFITFAKQNYEEGGKYIETLSDSTEYAGKRMEKALENLRLAIGRSLKDSGAGFQNFAAEAAENLLWLGQQMAAFATNAEMFLGGGMKTPGGTAKEIAERLIGGGITVREIEQSIQDYENKIKEANDRLASIKTRNILQTIFDETLGAGTPTQGQTATATAALEKRIALLREALKLANDFTRKGKPGAGGGGEEDTKAAQDRAKAYLQAFDQREEALANARLQREEQIADIRKNAIEQANQLERQFGDERRNIERDIARTRREITDIQADADLRRRAQAGADPYLVDAERGISEILRNSREERIRIENEYSDRELTRTRTIADFQKKVADDINKANEAYAKQVGNIQREYAKNVAKIIDEGSGAAGKRLETSSKIAALYLQRAALNQAVAGAMGVVVAEPGRAGENAVSVDALISGLGGAESPAFKQLQRPIRGIIDIDEQLKLLQNRLQKTTTPVTKAPVISPVSALPYSRRVTTPGFAATVAASTEQRKTALQAVDATEIDKIEQRFVAITDESTKQINNLKEQNALLGFQAEYLSKGINPELATQLAQLDSNYAVQKQRLAAERDAAINQGLNAQGITAFYSTQLRFLNEQQVVLVNQTRELEKQQELLRFRQDTNIGAGFVDGAKAYVESIGTMREATAQLAQTGIKGIEDAIFSLVTTGTANFREFAASILKDTARMIIQQLVLRTVMQAIGFLGGGGSSLAKTFEMPGLGFPTSGFSFAKGGTFANGIVPFAMGGIVNKPTLFKFANGGVPGTGLMGEAGPEAIIPLKRGPDGKLGVSGGGSTTNVTVNVDAQGTQAQGDDARGQQLGRVIAAAVQAELVKQKRPGGLLA
jgi:lambda family phage tail tape measure protein